MNSSNIEVRMIDSEMNVTVTREMISRELDCQSSLSCSQRAPVLVLILTSSMVYSGQSISAAISSGHEPEPTYLAKGVQALERSKETIAAHLAQALSPRECSMRKSRFVLVDRAMH
jgi:hypothetical protein